MAQSLDRVRQYVARQLGLVQDPVQGGGSAAVAGAGAGAGGAAVVDSVLWVVDFPMFEWVEDEKR